MSRLVSVEGESADKALHKSHASAGVPIAVQWRRPEAQTCRHRVQSQKPLAHGTQEAKKQVWLSNGGDQRHRNVGTGYRVRHLQRMVHRKLKSRASCPMEETRGTDL
jgi:hypothetical protein